MTIAEILKNLTKKRPAATLDEDFTSLAEAQRRAEAAISAAEARRQELLLTGTNQELAAVEQEIRELNWEADRAQAAMARLRPLIDAAKADERRTEMDRRGVEVRAKRRKLLELYCELDSVASRLVELLDAVDEGEREIRDANRMFAQENRDDLKVQSPLASLGELAGSVERLPRIREWRMHGYWPIRPGQHDVLGQGSVVAIPAERRFGRARELLENQEAS